MLIKSNYIYGIKKSNQSIEGNVKSIIDNAQNYLTMGSFSFWIPKPLFNSVKTVSANTPSTLLIPHVYRSGDVIIKIQTMQTLINANVGVIISGLNHSKFVFSESSIYYGSANLTNYGLNSNIEAITVYDTIRNDLKKDFIGFILMELNRYLNTQHSGLPIINSQIISNLNTIFGKVHKLNPNIMKVEKTVDSFEDCNSIIGKAIDSYFALLSFTDFQLAYRKLLVLKRNLEELYKYGSYVLNKEGYLHKNNAEKIYVDESRVNRYNKLWAEFNHQLKDTITLLENLPNNLRLLRERDELAQRNNIIISRLKSRLEEDNNNLNSNSTKNV